MWESIGPRSLQGLSPSIETNKAIADRNVGFRHLRMVQFANRRLAARLVGGITGAACHNEEEETRVAKECSHS